MFALLALFTQLGPKPCVVVNGSDEARTWLVKTVSVGQDFVSHNCSLAVCFYAGVKLASLTCENGFVQTTGMCEQPAGAADATADDGLGEYQPP